MKKTVREKSSIPLFPVILIVSILPLIMRLHGYDAHLAQYEWFSVGDHYTDCFLFYKASFFIIITGAMLLISIFCIWKKKARLKTGPALFPLAVYLLTIFLSSLYSVSPYHSLYGAYEQFEPAAVLTGYILTAWFTYTFITSEGDVRQLLKYWTVGIALLCIVGLFQFFNWDLYKTEFFARLIAGPHGTFEVTAQPGRVYMSLYNPNYVGLYTSVAFPVLAVLSATAPGKWSRAFYIILTAALLICLYGSSSKNGSVTVFILLIFLGVIFRKKLLKKKKIIASAAALGFFIFGIAVIKGDSFISQIKNAFDFSAKEPPSLKGIRTNSGNVEIDYNGGTIFITMRSDTVHPEDMLVLKDKEGQIMKTSKSPESYTLLSEDSRFPDFYAAPLAIENVIFHNSKINRQIAGFVVGIDHSEWIFTNQLGDGEYYYITKTGKADKIRDRSFPFLSGYESLFSGRGFIWSRTAPLLKKYIFKGSGPDTFAIVFPNNDYVGRHNFGYSDIVVTRPHNLYLQVAVQTGLLSLIAFLLFYFIYFIQSLCLYWKEPFSSFLPKTGAACLAGTAGYMISGLTNDSTITVTPIFWVLMGMGLAINEMVKKERAAV